MTGDPEERRSADDLAMASGEPLLPAEIKLIAWSLVLGAAALAALIWVSNAFFPG